jgi:hypothetical protein
MTKLTQARINALEIENAELKRDHPSLRDQFAMAALTGILINIGWDRRPTEQLARIAYYQADAMLEARNAKD